MAYFLRDGQWQDIATNTVDTGGSGWTDEAGNYFSPSGELLRMSEEPIAMVGGANINDPNRSFAPDVLSEANQAAFYDTHAKPLSVGANIPPTPEGMSFSQWLTYLYDNGLAGQDYNTGFTRHLNDYGYMVPLVAAAAFGGLAAGGAGAAGGASAGGAGAAGAGGIDAYMAGAGLEAGTFGGAGFTAPGAFTATELAGPTYAEMGYTGLPEGGMGPTYGEMGYTGLNQQAAINAADAASKGLTGADALRYANQARQALGVGSTLAKLVGGGGGVATGGKTGGTSQEQIAQYLRGLAAPAQTGPVPYQIKMNQNPFTFDIPGQTKATEGMYDVSGVNPMANALRKA